MECENRFAIICFQPSARGRHPAKVDPYSVPEEGVVGEAQTMVKIMLFFVMWFICYTYPYE